MDNGAIVPDNQPFMPPMTEEPVDTQQVEAEAADKQLSDITNHPAWDRIAAMMQEHIDEFKTLKSADLSGLKLEEVGQRFLVGRMVAEELEGILASVKVAGVAVRETEAAKRTNEQ